MQARLRVLHVDAQRRRKHLAGLRHTDGLRTYGLSTRRNHDVPRTLRRLRIVGNLHLKRPFAGSDRYPRGRIPLGLGFPRQTSFGRNRDRLSCRSFRFERQGCRFDRKLILHVTPRLNDRNALGLHILVVRRNDGKGTGTLLRGTVVGYRNRHGRTVRLLRLQPGRSRIRYTHFPLNVHGRNRHALRRSRNSREIQRRGLHLQRRYTAPVSPLVSSARCKQQAQCRNKQ